MIPRLTALLIVALVAVALLKPTSPKTGEKWGTRGPVLLSQNPISQNPISQTPISPNAVSASGQTPALINTCLITSNVAGLVDFYRHVLGTEPRTASDRYAEFSTEVIRF